MPPSAASAPARTQTSRITCWLLMPVAEARSGLSRHRARRLPEPGPLQRQGDRDQHHERDRGRDQVAWRDRDRTDVDALLAASSRAAAACDP